MLKRFWEWLLDEPAAQIAAFTFSTVLAGVFASSFVSEIAEQPLHWDRFWKTKSFWVLLVLSLLYALYSRALFLRQRDVMKWANKDYCLAYMNSQCLPEIAKRNKDAIRHGQMGDVEDFYTEAMKFRK